MEKSRETKSQSLKEQEMDEGAAKAARLCTHRVKDWWQIPREG